MPWVLLPPLSKKLSQQSVLFSLIASVPSPVGRSRQHTVTSVIFRSRASLEPGWPSPLLLLHCFSPVCSSAFQMCCLYLAAPTSLVFCPCEVWPHSSTETAPVKVTLTSPCRIAGPRSAPCRCPVVEAPSRSPVPSPLVFPSSSVGGPWAQAPGLCFSDRHPRGFLIQFCGSD